MVICAYSEEYLSSAQNILGHAVDFAVVTLGLEPDVFAGSFMVSGVSRQFAAGNPRYVAGMNGCELVRQILAETCTPFTDGKDAMFQDRSPEYWAGWALAYYQWHSGRPFMEILTPVPLSRIIGMYPVFHEMDFRQFADHMDELMRDAYPMTRLRMHRKTTVCPCPGWQPLPVWHCDRYSFLSRGRETSTGLRPSPSCSSDGLFAAGWRICWSSAFRSTGCR